MTISTEFIFGTIRDPLLVLDLANNHNGSVAHGKAIVDSVVRALEGLSFRTCVKFQYRDLDTLIHPDFKGDREHKYIKRFEDTKLSESQFLELIEYCRTAGFLVACTPFDERSVEKVVQHGFDILKVASASANDWPLLDEVAKHNLPTVVSTGGLSGDETDRVAAFMRKRVHSFALMHCVAIYPTPNNQLSLNRIDFMKRRYPGVYLGYSTHEDPNNDLAGPLALAKGAHIFERHVGLEAQGGVALNTYSSQESQLRAWATRIQEAVLMTSAMDDKFWVNEVEQESLIALRRGVYARHNIPEGTEIAADSIFLAMPVFEGQVTANMWSKLEHKVTTRDIEAGSKLNFDNFSFSNLTLIRQNIMQRIRFQLESAGVLIQSLSNLELSHHYGLERFEEFGCGIITLINRKYCKKIICLLPGQSHPEHYHKKKEETFFCISGVLTVNLNGVPYNLLPGEMLTIEAGIKHSFKSSEGAVFEEISSTHLVDDSYYSDNSINLNLQRKTKISIWAQTD